MLVVVVAVRVAVLVLVVMVAVPDELVRLSRRLLLLVRLTRRLSRRRLHSGYNIGNVGGRPLLQGIDQIIDPASSIECGRDSIRICGSHRTSRRRIRRSRIDFLIFAFPGCVVLNDCNA